MKKHNAILQAAVASALAVTFGIANAGTLTATSTVYAAEALTSATPVTTASLVYTMGVNRAIGQDFTIIFSPSTGSTFTPASCVGANFQSAAGTYTFSTKRASADECAIQVAVTGATTVGETITTSNALGTQALVLATHPLATAGSSVSYTTNLWDLGETARIDNSAALTGVVATSINAVNVYADASDTATIADVNATAGPLKGFLANATVPLDTGTVAAANLTFDNNSAGAKAADGVTVFDFTSTTGTTTVVLTDANLAFGGLAAGKLCLDVDNDATYCEAGETFAAAVSGAATLATIPAAVFAPQSAGPVTRAISFEADGVTSLSTTRTIALSGTVTPQIGAAHAFADTASKNATAWVWSANAIELWAPYFTTLSTYISRFAFQNTGIPVGYTAVCLAESGNTVTAGTAAAGTLDAGMTVINASDICNFSGATRGTVRFIINAPAGNIHGTYNLVAPGGVSIAVETLTRPFNAGTY